MPKNISMRLLGRIMLSFFKISPLSFGGGYAMLPAIEAEVVDRRKWMTQAEMHDIISISGSAPGGIGVNAAIFVGFRLAGLRGAVAALLGITLPTFVIVLLLLLFFHFFSDNRKVIAAMEGIQIAIIGLIAYAGWRMAKTAIIDFSTLVLFVLTVSLLIFSFIRPLFVIPLGAASGMLLIQGKTRLGLSGRTEKSRAEEHSGGNTGSGDKHQEEEAAHKYDDYFFGEGI